MRPISSEKEWKELQRVQLLGQGRGRFKTAGSGRVVTPPASGKEFLSERQVQAGCVYIWRLGHIVQDMLGQAGANPLGRARARENGALQLVGACVQKGVGAFVWRLLCVAKESVSFRLEGKF